jgi:Xaa-Pro aminopeptidase
MMGNGRDGALLAARRERIMSAMGGGMMLLAAAPERPRTADILYPYRQDSDFDYVTGFSEPDAVCVLAPDAPDRYMLFVRPADPERAIWVGPRAGVEGAVERYGADKAHPLEDLERVLGPVVEKSANVYHSVLRDDALAQRLLALIRGAQAGRPRTGTGPSAIRDPADILHEMRLRKEPDELERMRRAIAVACEAHREAMQQARPGMTEFEVEALIDYTFRRRGATGPAYPSIVASGPNATILHYVDNDRVLGDNDLLLIDAGAEHAGYCADVTRTFPVGRRYSGPQRTLYDAVLAAQQAAIDTIRPGATLEGAHQAAVRVLVGALLAEHLLEGSADEIVEKGLYRRFYMHRTSHWLGHDVHDVGNYAVAGAPRPLEPGMVLTVEPGLYLPADADDLPAGVRGVGIRIEDDVLVTPSGHEVLSAAAPKQVSDIETLRGS